MKTINVEMPINCIIIDGNYIKINNLVGLLKFTKTKEFEYITYKIFNFISKKKKLEKINIKSIFKEIGNDEINYLKLNDSFIPVGALLIDSAFGILEKTVGQKLMKDFLLYDDILNFQLCVKYCREYYSDKDLTNFTPQQQGISTIKYSNFMAAQNNLKEYIKLFCKNG